MARVTITIASTGRATLARTIESLEQMLVPPDTRVDVVIADDSRNGAVRRVLQQRGQSQLELRCLHVAAGNVSLARNACLDAATGDLIAFVDDDEWVARDWLVRMLRALDEFQADCVFGPVFPQYPPQTPAWVRQANPLFTDWGARGRIVTVGRCGNTLMKRALIDRHRLRFDHALGQVGGEDTDFFDRLDRHGARMVVTDDAHVFEDAPEHRLTLDHFRKRAVRKGQIYARFLLTRPGAGTLHRFSLGAGALAKMSAGLGGAALLAPFDRAAALRIAMRGWMNLGKLRELARLEPPRWT
jgi:succinoglycan biosynthesis protein ExoM